MKNHQIQQTKRSLPSSTNRDVYKSSYQSSHLIYDLRKQVLDKLDIIIQKVNLSVLKCLDSGTKNIKLISMTQIEDEIEDLLAKLDQCIANRQKSFRMYDNDVSIENQQLVKQNQQLRMINAELIERLEEQQQQNCDLSQISALQKQVQNLNSQISRYQNWRQSNSLQEQKFISHNKLLIQLHKIVKESGRLKLLTLGIKKVFKQYLQSFSTIKNDFAQKIVAMSSKWNQETRNVFAQNMLLKQEIRYWENDVDEVLNNFKERE